jgi:Do/DeqQ family serine protease
MKYCGTCRLAPLILAITLTGVAAQEREIAPMPSLAGLVDRTAPAVVSITITAPLDRSPRILGGRPVPPMLEEYLEDLPEESEGAGSGVIVDSENGYVLTNHHVIAAASAIRVTLSDRRSFEAAVLGSDELADLAILQIEADDLTAIPFAATNDLLVGDYVVAIGNPFGIGQTVTSGIVSALGRAGGFTDNNQAFEDFIQTDASINPGNSGGALVNLRGELVGINSAIISTGFGGGNVGIGFAIPADMIASVMGRLLEFGEVRRGLLGVYMRSVTPVLASDLGLGTTAGAMVVGVTSQSAAEAAGIAIYDVIVGINGERISADNELRNRIAMKLPGDDVELQVFRDGSERTVRAVLGSRVEDEPAEETSDLRPTRTSSPLDGMQFLAENEQPLGITVRAIAPRSLADNADVHPGDLIVAINRNPVKSVEDARRLADQSWTVVLEIMRDNQRLLAVLR